METIYMIFVFIFYSEPYYIKILIRAWGSVIQAQIRNQKKGQVAWTWPIASP